VLSQAFPSGQIDCSTLRKGVYFIKVTFPNGVIISNQIVKN
jgi:hypothetical protein